MAANVFAGARRIALVLGGLWTAGCLAYAAFSEPHVSLTYAIKSYGAEPLPAERCESRDGSKYTNVETPSGESVSVRLCFIADQADNGSYLIPYREVVSALNPEAARVYAARKEAMRQGAHADAAKLTEFLFKMPVNPWEPRTVWMAGEYDSEVRSYMDEVASAFKLPPNDMERLQQVRRKELWEQWKQALQVLGGGLLVGWVLVVVVGWVARGFAGIPSGKDFKT